MTSNSIPIGRAIRIARRMGDQGVAIVAVEFGLYPSLRAQCCAGDPDEPPVRAWAKRLGVPVHDRSVFDGRAIISFSVNVTFPRREQAKQVIAVLACAPPAAS